MLIPDDTVSISTLGAIQSGKITKEVARLWAILAYQISLKILQMADSNRL